MKMSATKIVSCFVLVFVLKAVQGGILTKLHEGVYQNVKGTIEGAKEVIGIPVKVEDLKFYLVTKTKHEEFNPLEPKNAANKEGRTFILIHGWQSSVNKSGCAQITNALLKTYPDSLVIQVDWSKAAADAYPFAAYSTESIGDIVANLLIKLVAVHEVPLKNIVLMGHSLGGQICSWTGKKYKSVTNYKLPRIIALDPAGPLFISRPNSKRLNKDDAEVVHVIHTDGGKLGFQWSCGSIDFFPNGGSSQPGCYQIDLEKLSSLADPITCDHSRVWDTMTEAIENKGSFEAQECESFRLFQEDKCNSNETAFMGDLELNKTGKFYLITNDKYPFSQRLSDRKIKKSLLPHIF